MVLVRNKVIGTSYRNVLKPILFQFDPEKVHDRFINTGRVLGKHAFTRELTNAILSYENIRLSQVIKGVKFTNPIGLSAGFDKDANLVNIIGDVGFGFIEVGSVTGKPCKGNDKPRLWRLKKSKSLLVFYGLMNDGCEKIAERLKDNKCKVPLGISIAKTNDASTVETEAGIKDYYKAFDTLKDIGDFFVINISCPNAFGGEPFTDVKKLESLLSELDKIKVSKPIFLKLSPDLDFDQVDEILDVANKHNVDGFICTNLTKKNSPLLKDERPFEKGGMSGKVVNDLSVKLVRQVYTKTKGEKVIIGCGGVFNAEDAYKMMRNGASLVQMITGMVFQGPQVISEINMGLVRLMERDGINSIRDLVGIDVKKVINVESNE